MCVCEREREICLKQRLRDIYRYIHTYMYTHIDIYTHTCMAFARVMHFCVCGVCVCVCAWEREAEREGARGIGISFRVPSIWQMLH